MNPGIIMSGVLIKKRNLETETDMYTGECHVKTKENIRWCIYKPENAKDCYEIIKARREAWNR